jgi:DNA-binding GntR family transcriptional regulator
MMQQETNNGVIAQRVVFREEIRNAIREAIFAGELKPGDRIIETTWAKGLGVSQGPVREAIRDLEAMGLVETIPFKGSRVRSMTEKDIRDNYSVRICLESKSIRDAITMLSDEQLKEMTEQLYKILEEMDNCARDGDLLRFTSYDTAFHRTIILATGNEVLLRFWDQCNNRNWFTISAMKDSAVLKQLQHQHMRIFTAICNKNAEEATSTLEGHLTQLVEDYVQQDRKNKL